MSFLLNQIALAFWNLVNSRIDAYRILRHKAIAHGVNFVAYALFTAFVLWISHDGFRIRTSVLFCISAFLNRQLTFDIPLNLRRGLPWYYQSMDEPPKAWWDRFERYVFGIDYDGRKIVYCYSMLYSFTIIAHLSEWVSR